MRITPTTSEADRTTALAGALTALELERFADAAALCAPLIAACPEDFHALCLCGLAHGAMGRVDEAARLLHRAAVGRGGAAHPMFDLIALLRQTGRTGAIGRQIRAALVLDPGDPGLTRALAEWSYDAGEFQEAVTLLEENARRHPPGPSAMNLLALSLAALGRTQEAIRHLRTALARFDGEAGLWGNLGLLLKDEGQFADSIAAYDRAVALRPDDARIRVNRVVALLRAGRWAEAWPDYEWRLSLPEHAVRRPRLLRDANDVARRTILAVHEDGFGDTLHFARYLPILAARGARVIAAVPGPLAALIGGIDGVAGVCDPNEPWPAHDFYCPFFSLPRAFGTTPETIPCLALPSRGYLRANPAAAGFWRDRLGPKDTMRVGLVWAGQARPAAPGFAILDGRRSLTLAAFAPFASVPGVTFVSLQHGLRASENPPEGMRLIDPMGAVRDFAETAAIVANLDLVISVDTAVVHLAGGLGTPVFMLDRHDHCWRWLSGRDDSPWYPAMRIFRQPGFGDWATPIAAAVDALAALASGA